MEFKKNIAGKSVRLYASPWTFKVGLEVGNETVYESSELMWMGSLVGIIMLLLGVAFGLVLARSII